MPLAYCETFKDGFRSGATLGRMRAPLRLGPGVWTVKGPWVPATLEGIRPKELDQKAPRGALFFWASRPFFVFGAEIRLWRFQRARLGLLSTREQKAWLLLAKSRPVAVVHGLGRMVSDLYVFISAGW